MAKKFWIQAALAGSKAGSLRKTLKAKAGKLIPAGKLKTAAHKHCKVGQRARLAMTLRKLGK